MELSKVVIGLILFGMVVTGAVSFYGEVANFWGVEQDGNYTATYDKIQASLGETNNLSRDISEKVQEGEGVLIESSFATLGTAAYEAVKMPFKAISIILTLISDVGSKIGIPTWATNAIISMLLIAISFAVLAAVLRFRA